MKKKVFVIFFFLLILSAFFISAETNQSVDDKGYSCLLSKVTNNCASLSTEEKIFSLLAVGQCKTELLSDSSGNQCWPQSGCTIKTTAQAIMALSQTGSDTSQAESWLSSRNMTYPNIDWLLQIDTTNSTSCTANYLGGTYSFSTNEDKTLSGSAGSCLSLYQNYWLKISPNCYNQDIQISCSDSFMTSLLYKKKTSDTVYVSDKTVSAAGEGTTTERVNSLCFSSDGSSCDYEGTLWAALVLKSRGKDVSAYIPYLIALADDNSKYVPYSFIYSLTGNFRTDLLAQQQQNQWWSASGDKIYDTAVALLPFQNENSLLEKTNSQNWLTQIQGTDGCWQDNIRNTAFILYSLWPRQVSTQISPDCQNSGNYCTSSALCSSVSGNVLSNYSGCFGTNVCCDKQPPTPSCADQNGQICSSGQTCIGGTTVSSSDTTSLTSCCINGNCGTPTTSDCELNNGVCKSSCATNEQFASYSCSSGVCCIAKPAATTSNVLLIILLVVLIVLVALGIIFRNKLRILWLKFKSKGKGKPSAVAGGPRFPPTSSAKVYPGAIPRKIITPQQPQRMPVRPMAKNKPEYDEVLKKLKEMGK